MPLPEMKDEFKFPDEIEAEEKASTDNNFTVEIEDDTPVPDRNRKPLKEPVEEITDAELESYDEKVQKRIKRFTHGYHDERRAKEEAIREREAAEVFARQVYEENKRLQHQVSNGSKAYIETAKGAAEGELSAAKKKYKEAYEQGDVDAITEAQADIARATLKVDKTSGMRPVEIDEKYDAPPPQRSQTQTLDRRTQQWVESNTDWWGKDDEMTAAALGLDKKLAKEYGSSYIGTEEYFKTIDKTMRKRFPEHFNDVQSNEEDAPPPRKRASEPDDEDDSPRRAKPASVVAPATRSTPPNRIKLRASQAAIARRLGVPLEEYAKQVAQIGRNE